MGYAFGKPYKSVRKLEEPIRYLISINHVCMHSKPACITVPETDMTSQ